MHVRTEIFFFSAPIDPYFGRVSWRFRCWVESGDPGCVTRLSDLEKFPVSLSDLFRLAAESAGPGQLSKTQPVAGWKQSGQAVEMQHDKTCGLGERHKKSTTQ